ncbi:hypothetical protein EDD53_2132 [Pacificibacter maritimus]|uniref:Uncharacterized protein n=1 Tax=Pacificibacter maritimus TaxID=762213 RepID=A0A3N4UXX3_9RHOB|nr:hypothetical protein [Pacificibacter maritimus]RPE66430.1 hypothetical protein EDD53_2132 [Pacificibacter maritimus]
MSGVTKILLVVIVTPIILIIAFVALFVFEMAILYPKQYERLQGEVTAWNQENWETGFASRVTVQVTSNEALGGNTAVTVLDCYDKRFASPHSAANGPPHTVLATMSDGPDTLSIPFGSDATHITSLQFVCAYALRQGAKWQLPHEIADSPHQSDIVANDQSLACFLDGKTRTSKGEVSRLTFVGSTQVPLSEIISYQDYHDLRQYNASYPPRLPKHYWQASGQEAQCWRSGHNGDCMAKAENICGIPLP